MTPKRILFVDDDTNVLQGLQRMLRGKRGEWDMVFADSAHAALVLLDQSNFQIVVSDFRMPGMDGGEFLRIVAKKHPELIRIILSGQTDRNLLLQSVDLAHQFIAKPCDAELLKTAIESACGIRDILKNESLRKLVTRIEELPTLPVAYLQLLEEMRSTNASIEKIGRIISGDMGMSVKILRLANSAFFGVRQHISDPALAASLLGIETIKALVLSVQVFKRFDEKTLKAISIQELWQHSMMTGAFAQAIAKTENQNQNFIADSLMAGMLHDIGKPVLAAKFPDAWQAIHDTPDDQRPAHEAESETFGATHAELGAYMLGLWGMNDLIVEATAFHHIPGECARQSFSLLTVVHAANQIQREMTGTARNAAGDKLDREYLNRANCAKRLSLWWDICAPIKEELLKWTTKF